VGGDRPVIRRERLIAMTVMSTAAYLEFIEPSPSTVGCLPLRGLAQTIGVVAISGERCALDRDGNVEAVSG